MIFFDGIYRLQAESDDRAGPRAEWSYAWRIRIIDLSVSRPGIRHLKPFVVFVDPAGDGIFRTNCAESLGKKVCRDFRLDVAETLWFEYLSGPPAGIYRAGFLPKFSYGPENYYNICWRPIRPNERAFIRTFIPEVEALNRSQAE